MVVIVQGAVGSPPEGGFVRALRHLRLRRELDGGKHVLKDDDHRNRDPGRAGVVCLLTSFAI